MTGTIRTLVVQLLLVLLFLAFGNYAPDCSELVGMKRAATVAVIARRAGLFVKSRTFSF